MRRSSLLVLAGVPVAILAGSLPAPTPAGATAQALGQCSTSSGVILAVDFGHWGGPVERACGSTPTDGSTLLHQGGWTTEGTKHDGPAFVCRIGYSGFRSGRQYPTPDTEACANTPPTSAYWSYWHAAPGRNSWSYSQGGASNSHPEPGSVDAWVFGATDLRGGNGGPTFSPDSVRAHNTAPAGGAPGTPTARPSAGSSAAGAPTRPRPGSSASSTPASPPIRTAGGGAGSSTVPGGAGSAGRSGSAAPDPSASGTSGARTPGAAPSGATSGTSSPGSAASGTAASGSASSDPRIVDAEPAPVTRHRSGSAVPALLAAAVVAALGLGAVVSRRRRRRAD